MFGRYSKKDMQRLAQRLKEEYSSALERQRQLAQTLREENSTLRARIAQLEDERKEVAGAMLRVEREGKRMREEGERSQENARREFELLAEKCRLLSESLLKKYPDSEDGKAFSAFTDSLSSQLAGEEGDGAFDLDAVLAPKEPLDLGKLCKELGLMEDEE